MGELKISEIKLPELTKDGKYTYVTVVVGAMPMLVNLRGAQRFVSEANKYSRDVFLRKENLMGSAKLGFINYVLNTLFRKKRSKEITHLKSIEDILNLDVKLGEKLEIVVEGVDKAAENFALRIYSGIISGDSTNPYFGLFEKGICTMLSGLIKEQTDMMGMHLKEHKYFRGIADEGKAFKDFGDNFGWIMREMYCENICSESGKCKAYANYVEGQGWKRKKLAELLKNDNPAARVSNGKIEMSCSHLSDFLCRLEKIIELHISEHKWFNGIEDPEKAVADFIDKYVWIPRKMYCKSLCKEKEKCENYKQYLARFAK